MITQVGGVIYLLTIVLGKPLDIKWQKRLGAFVILYFVVTLVLIPSVAPFFGRVALPLTGNLKPLNLVTCFLNRHYVVPDLEEQLKEIAGKMNTAFEGTQTNYLDANFPFFNGFPLLPHLSHDDGRKVDLAFYYKHMGQQANAAPSFIGYGIYEAPVAQELDYPERCKKQGYWQYGMLAALVPQWNKREYELDVKRTRHLIKLLASSELTSKIFIEPHLKDRWKLTDYNVIRFHGCQSVRHDDHIHTQIR